MAANAGAIRAGRAFVEIFADDSKLNRSLGLALGKLQAFGENVRALGQKMVLASSVALAPFGLAVKAFVSQGDELAKAAQRTGISVEALSELKYAADQSGSSLAELEEGVKGMARFMESAADGSKEAAQALTRLGISFDELQALSPEDRFMLLADRVSKLADPTERAAIAMQLFGKSNVQLLPMLKDGAIGIERLREAARELGLTMSTEDALAAEQLGDALDDLWKVVTKTAFAVGSALAPMVKALAVSLTGAVKAANDWIKAHKDIVRTVVVCIAIFGTLGAALVATGIAIKVVAFALTTATGLFNIALAVVGTLKVVLLALITPLGLIGLAIAGVGAAILYWTDTGGVAVDWLRAKFTEFGSAAAEVWKGIVNAVKSGDLALAGQIAFGALRVGWVATVGFLKAAWAKFKQYFLEMALGAFYGAQATWEITSNSIAGAWVSAVKFMGDIWAGFQSIVRDGWEGTMNWLEDRWLDVLAKVQGLDRNDLANQANQDRAKRNKDSSDGDIAGAAQREADHQAALAALEEAHRKRMEEIGKASIGDSDAVKAQTEAEIAAAQAELAKAKADLQKLVDESNKRAAAGAGGGDIPKPTPGPNIGEASDAFSQRMQSRGVLSGFATQGLNGGGIEKKLDGISKSAKALEQLAKSGFNVSVFYR